MLQTISQSLSKTNSAEDGQEAADGMEGFHAAVVGIVFVIERREQIKTFPFSGQIPRLPDPR